MTNDPAADATSIWDRRNEAGNQVPVPAFHRQTADRLSRRLQRGPPGTKIPCAGPG